MRLAIPMRRAALFTAMFAFALLLFLPLRLVLGWVGSGLGAREASGSVWTGSLMEARVGPALLGDLDARVSPLPLLVGHARLAIARKTVAPDRFAGVLAASLNGRSLESVTGTVPIDQGLATLPIASIDLTDVTVRLRDGQCERAEGLVRANLSGIATGSALAASLSGAARCDRGALLLPLADGQGSGRIDVRFYADGRWVAVGAGTQLKGRF